MERWHSKAAATVAVFLIPFVCTILPLKVASIFEKRGDTGKKVLGCLMCFGGGVFFATYMLHMGPEVRAILHAALIVPYNIKYPVADLMMGVGFFLVMFMEKLVISISHRKKAQQEAKRKQACLQFNKPYMPVSTGENPSMPLPKASLNGTANSSSVNPAADSCPLRGTGDCCSDPADLKIQCTDEEDINIVSGQNDNGPLHSHPEAEILQDSTSTRSLVLLVALSLHRIFEGMSIGLQHSTHNVWNLFLAVMCHETVIGFSLGLEFVKNRWAVSRIMLACFLCSLIMPLGTIIGTLISELGNANSANFDLINGLLQGVATGTFIYVTFFEILQEEISPHETGVAKMVSVVIGFLVMAALCTIPEEDDMLNLPAVANGNFSTTIGY